MTMRFTSLLLIIVFLGASSCVQPQAKIQRSQLEIRELQTREYPAKNTAQAMKAVISALQDEGFMIRNADKDLGFISATKEADVTNPNEAFWAQLFAGDQARFNKSSLLESSVSVMDGSGSVRIRAVFQAKTLDNFGLPVDTRTVEDAKYYQEFFSKVDKSLFYANQGL